MVRITQRDLLRFLGRTVPVLALGLSLACACLLASSAYLHHLVHHDANSPSHECVATIMVKGDLLTPSSSGVSIPPPPLDVVGVGLEPASRICKPDLSSQASRAPPLRSRPHASL